MNGEEYDKAYAEGFTDGQNQMEDKMTREIEDLKYRILEALKLIRYSVNDAEDEV